VVSFTSRPLYYQKNSPWYPLARRLGGPQSLSGCGGEEKNSQLLPGLEPPIIQPVVQRYTTVLLLLLIMKLSKGCEYERKGKKVNLSLFLCKYYAMKTYGVMEL
jgi:hypothetical protein